MRWLLMSRTLSPVGRRALRERHMTAIRARNPKSWPTLCVDEAGLLDSVRV